MTEYTVQKIDGVEYIILQQGTAIHQIDVGAISSWGVLLGTTDTREILEAILKEGRSSENLIDWEELYSALGNNLDEMSKAGVPVEFSEILLDPELGSPVPGKDKVDRLENARQKVRDDVADAPDGAILLTSKMCDEIREEILSQKPERLEQARLDFIDELSPEYEIRPVAPVQDESSVFQTGGVDEV